MTHSVDRPEPGKHENTDGNSPEPKDAAKTAAGEAGAAAAETAAESADAEAGKNVAAEPGDAAGASSEEVEKAAGAPPAVPQEPAPPHGVQRTGAFHIQGTGDTSGFGGLVIEPYVPAPATPPLGGYFDELVAALAAAMAARSIPGSAVLQTTVTHGEIAFFLAREHLPAMLFALRDDPSLRFELLSSLSGVDYGPDAPKRLHVVYEMCSLTYRRRARLEVSVDVDDPYVPSAVPVYPTADWHEREVWDMFGVQFSGHPGLTRILMPDDWDGFPQRKDYPLGGIPVEYKGAEIPAPDQRRAYT